MKIQICVILLVGVIASLDGKAMKKKSLTPIGQVGDKHFFVNHEEITWQSGKELCEAQNMIQATISTREEIDFLDKALTDLNEFSHYFTAGVKDIVWSTTGEVFDPTVLGGLWGSFGDEVALTIHVPRAEYDGLSWDLRERTDEWPVICQQ